MATRDETMKLEKNEEIGYVAGAGVKLTWDKVNIFSLGIDYDILCLLYCF